MTTTHYADGFDPSAPPKSFGTDTDTPAPSAAQRASDARMSREAAATSASARHNQRANSTRPTLRPVLTGRAAEEWDPVHKRRMRGHQRVAGKLTIAAKVDPVERLIATARQQGESGEPVDDILAEIVEHERHAAGIDAAARARRILAQETARLLTEDVREHKGELYAAIRADLVDLRDLAQTCADGLDGITSAEQAIAAGDAAVSAWQTVATVRERVLAVAGSLHWVRRAIGRGFAVDQSGRPDAWPSGVDENLTPSTTWGALDVILTDLKVSDTARGVMLGDNGGK